jgi:predicted secreted protein
MVCHCILNANAKIHPLAQTGGVYNEVIADCLESGTGLVQLPCPELSYLGMKRWGMTKEQYDVPAFRAHCQRLLSPVIDQLRLLVEDGCTVTAVMGMDGSPNCGVRKTCTGYVGGEIASGSDLSGQVANLAMVDGMGVFFEELSSILTRLGIKVPFDAVNECPGADITAL